MSSVLGFLYLAVAVPDSIDQLEVQLVCGSNVVLV
jgi:hypothetical protein